MYYTAKKGVCKDSLPTFYKGVYVITKAFFDDLDCLLAISLLVYRCRLILQRLIDREEMLHLLYNMGR